MVGIAVDSPNRTLLLQYKVQWPDSVKFEEVQEEHLTSVRPRSMLMSDIYEFNREGISSLTRLGADVTMTVGPYSETIKYQG